MHKLYNKNVIEKSSLYYELFSETENFIKEIYTAKNQYQLKKIKQKIVDIDISNRDETLSNKKILIKNLFFSCLKAKEALLCINNTNPTFNLNKIICKKLFSGYDINKLQNKYNIKNKFIGSMPGEFFGQAEQHEKRKTATLLSNIFLKYTYVLNLDFEAEDDNTEELKTLLNSGLKKFEKELSLIIGQKVSIKYIEHGTFGNVFKISANTKCYACKIFFPYNKFPDTYINKYHGCFFEPQAGLYAYKSTSKNLFTRFYAGKISAFDEPYSYMICDWVTNDNTAKDSIPFHHLTIDKEEQKPENILFGKIVDFGGMCIEEKLLKDKKFARMVRIIWQNLNYKHEKEQITWKLNQKNIDTIQKFCLDKNYTEAVNLIKHRVKHIPRKLVKTLKNIKNAQKLSLKEDFNLYLYKTKQDVLKNIQKFKICLINDYCQDNNKQGYFLIKHNDIFKRIYFKNNIIEKIENV